MSPRSPRRRLARMVAIALVALMSGCDRDLPLEPGGTGGGGGSMVPVTTGSGGAAPLDAGGGSGGSAQVDAGGSGGSAQGCSCAPGGGIDVLACGRAWPSFAGRDAPDAVVTGDGNTVAMNRCVPDAGGDCTHGLFLWTKAGGTIKLADQAWAFALSDDGRTVLAERDPDGIARSFLWNAGTVVDLPFGGALTHLLSSSGTVVVSIDKTSPDVSQASRWTAANGLERLGDLAGGPLFSEPLAMTADASAVVGYGNTALGQEPFLWTAETGKMINLGQLPSAPTTGVQAVARAISGDGRTVVGTALGSSGTLIFRWTETSGMVSLAHVFQNVPGPSSYFFIWTPPLLVSADGAAVIGTAAGDDPRTVMAFRWTEVAGVVPLTPGASSIVRGASLDGRRILGSRVTSSAPPGTPALPGAAVKHAPFIWDEGGGAREIAGLLAGRGANLAGVVLGDPIALSADGTTMVGHAACGASEIIFRASLDPVP